MSDHKSAPMSPEERAWTEYLRWIQGAAQGEEYEQTERRAWTRLQLALMPPRVGDGPEAGDVLDAMAALDSSDPEGIA